MGPNALIERLDQGPVVVGIGYVFALRERGYLNRGHFVPTVLLDERDVVKQLHREFVHAGSDVIEALQYYATISKLDELGMGREDFERINHAALDVAFEAKQEVERDYGVKPLVAGNVCNTFEFGELSRAEYDRTILSAFDWQIELAKDRGVDYIAGETYPHLGEALAHLKLIKKHGLAAAITLSAIDTSGLKTMDGYNLDNACAILEAEGADVVGLNCTRGPFTLLPLLYGIREKLSGHIGALPVPYVTTDELPTMQLRGGENYRDLLRYPHTPDDMGMFGRIAELMGINYVGICCGNTGEMTRAVAESLGRKVPGSKYSPVAHRMSKSADVKLIKAWGTDPSEYGGEGYTEAVLSQRTHVPVEMARRAVRHAPKKTAIDVGCGTGVSGWALRAAGFTDVVGFDYSQRMLDFVPPHLYADVSKMDLATLPEDMLGKYPVVFSSGAIGNNPTADLEQLLRLAQSNGVAAFSVPSELSGEYEQRISELAKRGIINHLEDYTIDKDSDPTGPWNVFVERVLVEPENLSSALIR